MKISTKKKESKDLSKWHEWFAWYPVKDDDYWYWLETVERRITIHGCNAGEIVCIEISGYK